jgi:hypothetical protein
LWDESTKSHAIEIAVPVTERPGERLVGVLKVAETLHDLPKGEEESPAKTGRWAFVRGHGPGEEKIVRGRFFFLEVAQAVGQEGQTGRRPLRGEIARPRRS